MIYRRNILQDWCRKPVEVPRGLVIFVAFVFVLFLLEVLACAAKVSQPCPSEKCPQCKEEVTTTYL